MWSKMIRNREIPPFLLCLVVFTVFSRCYALDATLDSGNIGEDVVEACIEKIDRLNVFANDFGFLKRIALVETNYGSSIATLGYGMWQISNHIQDQLSSATNQLHLDQFISVALANFGNEIVNFTDTDYSMPLRSALAARMYIQLVGGPINLPASLEDQALWWSTYYKPGGVASTFESTVSTEESIPAARPLDIWFMLDGSASIGPINFQTSLDFIANMTSQVNPYDDDARAGFSVFSLEQSSPSTFSSSFSQIEFNNAVKSVVYPEKNTLLGAALTEVVSVGFAESGGARPISEGVPRILVVLTDGLSRDDTTNATIQARSAGITIIGIGIGNGIDEVAMNDMVEQPSTSHAFILESFNQSLDELQHSVYQQIIKTPAQLQVGNPLNTDVKQNEPFYASYEVLRNSSITLQFEVAAIEQTGDAYISTTTHNPNSANYDFTTSFSQGAPQIIVNITELSTPAPSSRKRRYLQTEDSIILYLTVKCTSVIPLQLTLRSTET